MNVEQLLKKRYEVVQDYPYTPFEIGWILHVEQDGELYGLDTGYVASKSKVMEADALKYPAIFRPLMWWEHREDSGLPMYLKNLMHHTSAGEYEIVKVVKYEPYYVNDADILHWSYYAYPEWNPNEGFPMIWFEPATEQEYNDYLTNKNS